MDAIRKKYSIPPPAKTRNITPGVSGRPSNLAITVALISALLVL
jgi:hypothetical protein